MKYLILGNWKSNGRAADLAKFGSELTRITPNLPYEVASGVAVPYHLVAPAGFTPPYLIGAQNVSAFGEGAYTGEITSGMLAEMGTRFCLVGHSERRQYFAESVPDTDAKLHRLLNTNIFPVFCIGETLTQRQAGALEAVLREQLGPILNLEEGHVAIAYEPVWAIGTGMAATPADVAQAHGMIRGMIADTASAEAPILYGGSVKPQNAEALSAIDEVAGFLVGGASLKADSFCEIAAGFIGGKQL